jgi:hypothetical protein
MPEWQWRSQHEWTQWLPLLALVRPFNTWNFPCLYCDGIFAIHSTILPRCDKPMPEQMYLNLKFASERQCIEHCFFDHRTRFKLFWVPHYFHLFDRRVKVQMQCLLSFLMLNCYYCLGETRSGYFGHATPKFEEYLPSDEQLLPPPAIDLGDTWDFWIQGPHNIWVVQLYNKY